MEQEKSVSTPNYVRLVLVNWYKVVAGMLICAIVGTVYALRMPRTYESTATLLVYPPFFKEAEASTRARTEAEAKLDLDEMMPRTFPVDTYKVLAKSKELVKDIIAELGLTDVTVEGLSESAYHDATDVPSTLVFADGRMVARWDLTIPPSDELRQALTGS